MSANRTKDTVLNILIYSANPQSPHMETELELASLLSREGNRVTLVRCTGQLATCLVNPSHSALICASCKAKYRRALDLAQLEKVDFIELPAITASYDGLPDTFASVEELKAFHFEGFGAGAAVASTLIGRFNKDHKFDTVKYRKAVRKELEMYLYVLTAMQQVIETLRPDEVYFFNGRFSLYHPVKSLCIRSNITYYTHERGGVMNKYILRKNAMPHTISAAIDELTTLWNDASPVQRSEIGAKFFTDRRNHVVQSWLPFTESQEKGHLPPSFSRNKKNIVIFNSTMEEYEGMDEWRNPLYKDDNDGLRRIFESFENDPDYNFFLRVHPNLRHLRNSQVAEIHELAATFQKNVHVIHAEEPYDSYALMEHATKVISFGSTIGAEATFWGKVSILAGKSLYMDIDACYQPATHEELVALIRDESLQPKPKENAVKYGYWELTKGHDYKIFRQTGLFSMSLNGATIEAPSHLRILEKVSKLSTLRNKRNALDVFNKLKKIFK